MEKQIYTQKELQKILKKSNVTIWKWKKKGLPVLDGNLFDWNEVEVWLKRNRNKAQRG